MANPCEITILTIPAQVSYTGVAAAHVGAVASQWGFDPELGRQLGQSLGIILHDLITRAFGPADKQAVRITCGRLPIGLQVTLAEQGLPLAAAELAGLADEPGACPVMPLGEQLTCVRNIWDEAAFHNLGRAGAELELIKYLPGPGEAAADRGCPAAPLTPPAGPAAGGPQTFTIRPFLPADAQAIVRLMYRTYGYSYPFEHLYYPERVIGLNADGSLQSLVAVSSQGELAGHLAIWFFPGNTSLAEMGAAVVHPDFRGQGCLRQLTEYALEEAGRRGLQALFGRPVTSHIYSQKVSEDLGFSPCGLLVGFGPAFMSFKNIREDLTQRESMVLIYHSLSRRPPGTIFPPVRHRDIILKLYAGLGLTPEVGEPGDAAPPAETQAGSLEIKAYAAGGIATIRVPAVGPETPAEVRRHLKELCLARFEVIHLQVDLSRPEAAYLVQACESWGFFFAGILPGLNNTQTLILQYLNNVPLDYDRIQLHAPQARDLLAYVRQADPNLS